MSRSLVTNWRSRDSLNRRTRCGCSPWVCQIRCTELTLIPTCLAIIWAVQWVTSPGGSVCVSATVCSCTVAGSRGIRDGRVLSRTSPSTPCVMKRSCQRHTVTLLLPVCRMIVFVPMPSAVISTMRARHTCFCGLFRSATIAAKRTRSPSLTWTVIPLRMLSPHYPAQHTPSGLFRQILSTSLDRTFGNDLVAIDSNAAGDKFVIVSRGGNQVFRATLDDSGKLNILNAAKTRVDCRLQTGNLPSGVAMRQDGTRAYANNEANFSVTSMDTNNCLTRQLDISSSNPPAPGSFEHNVLVGKLAFFTALGIPDNGFQGTDIRDIIPRNFRGKASKDAWSSCGSCHADGLSDGVTWIFGTGPRRTKPLDGMFSKQDPEDQDILNWSSIRDSNTDFNNNSRGVQGGCGFASDKFDPGSCFANGNTTKANPAIYDHGITQGGSDALDAQTLWIFAAVRPLHQPQPPGGTTAGQR